MQIVCICSLRMVTRCRKYLLIGIARFWIATKSRKKRKDKKTDKRRTREEGRKTWGNETTFFKGLPRRSGSEKKIFIAEFSRKHQHRSCPHSSLLFSLMCLLFYDRTSIIVNCRSINVLKHAKGSQQLVEIAVLLLMCEYARLANTM